MTSDLSGFTPESFEQFVRALAVHVFGPGVTAFGNGPDGGREATFRGNVPYPYPPTERWSGYGVMQAKCKEKSESTKLDQQWALSQLNSEFRKFAKSEKRAPKPDYYVFVTNVELTSASGGGKEQAEALIRAYYRTLPLKGHAIWDANQIATFLSTYSELRRAFAAYLTTGDLLATLLNDLQRRQPNLLRTLTAYLERELRADVAARLDQAGNRTDEPLRLARLFFDLPASEKPALTPPQEHPDNDGRLPPGVLYELLRSGSRKLDAATIYEQEVASEANAAHFPTRFVLLGGPGSGKSTIGQFLTQIHRAALLDRRPPSELLSATRQIVGETKERCDRERLPWPSTPRYPMRVELNRFAKAMASKEIESLIQYLTKEIGRDEQFSSVELHEVLEKYPWLLILDGLDEVPATSNRDNVVSAIDDFLAAARRCDADLFIVATSRQQGYAGEFGVASVAFRHMLPLSTARALRYVERYVESKYGANDPNRARDVINQMRQSAGAPLTAQLMSSPLQVTFMVTVVAARGDPGQNRWQLFNNYYRTIYERELQKAVPPYDEVLGKHQSTIDRLHHDIGFWLQFTGETTRGLSVSLPLRVFELLVRRYLSQLGQEERATQRLVKRIVDAASQRLVFLTSRTEGELSFDVRSLQEYMAAECIMTGDPELVRRRLRSIASAVYWRNVFLFATSRCFAEATSRHLQDAVRLLCADLRTTDDPLLSVSKAGAELALDVLQSGALAENISYARHLADIALDLAERLAVTEESREGPSPDRRIALAYRKELQTTYEPRLRLLLGQVELARTLGAWPIVLRLMRLRAAWATSLANSAWPNDKQAQWRILTEIPPELQSSLWVSRHLDTLLSTITPEDVLRHLFPHQYGGFKGVIAGALRTLTGSFDRYAAVKVGACPGGIWIVPVSTKSKAILRAYAAIARMPSPNNSWLPLTLAHDFLIAPGAASLAKYLSALAAKGWSPEKPEGGWERMVPWPLALCLRAVNSATRLFELAEAARLGKLGDLPIWEDAENRWTSRGIDLADVQYEPADGLPFDSSIAFRGWPSAVCGISFGRHAEGGRAADVGHIVDFLAAVPRNKLPSFSFFALCSAAARAGASPESVDPALLRSVVEKFALSDDHDGWWADDVVCCPENASIDAYESWIEFYDWLGQSEYLYESYPLRFAVPRSGKVVPSWGQVWQLAYVQDPRKVGLLRLLAHHVASGYVAMDIPESLLKPEHVQEPMLQICIAVLLITRPQRQSYSVARLAQVVVEALDRATDSKPEKLLFRAVEQHLESVSDMTTFLVEVHKRTTEERDTRLANAERLIRQGLRRRVSDLQQNGRLQELGLPEVLPVSAT